MQRIFVARFVIMGLTQKEMGKKHTCELTTGTANDWLVDVGVVYVLLAPTKASQNSKAIK